MIWVLSEMEVPISLYSGWDYPSKKNRLFMDAYLLLVPVSGDFGRFYFYIASHKNPLKRKMQTIDKPYSLIFLWAVTK